MDYMRTMDYLTMRAHGSKPIQVEAVVVVVEGDCRAVMLYVAWVD